MISNSFERISPVALTVLRLVVAAEMFFKGLSKIENLSRAPDLALGIHLPGVMGYIPAIMEPVGGMLLAVGLGTRWVSLYFMTEMVFTGIISKMIVRGVPFIMGGGQPGSGWELDSLIFAGAFVLFALGAGPLALDRLLARSRARGGSAPPLASQAPA
ncbi:MAG TPA: DoxX family protein [Chloroflexota bacterium]|nr:DoxX family protein [Chloroflexota bacterium]